MALRITTLETGLREEATTPQEWQRLVQRTLAAAERAALARDVDALRQQYETVAAWSDPQRTFQARKHLTEIVFGASEHLPGDAWGLLYEAAATALFDALDQEPREPVLLNYAGVLLYELTELGAAEDLFRAALRLDPELPHAKRNLAEAKRRKRAPNRVRLQGALAVRARALGVRGRRIAAAAKPVEGLTVSLCMIVKDEEEMLPGCLEAIAHAVDEIVIVDTGSSDRTVEIAESFGARIVEHPWNGSFSDARNAGIDVASGDWILYLDADEHLVPEDATRLRGLLGRTWREGFYLVETNYTGGDDAGSAVTHMALRLFRNRPKYRFEGRIHEQKTHTMPLFLPERFEATAVRVKHYGYLKSRINAKEKSQRNIELLEVERRESPSPFNSFNLGSEYLAIGESEEARRHFDDAWETLRGEDDWSGVGYAPILVSRVVKARRACGDLAGARDAIALGLEMYPDYTDLVLEEALCAKEAGELGQAGALAERSLAMGDAPARFTSTVGSGTYLALGLLADVRARQGREAEAEELLRRSLHEYPDFVAAILPLTSLLIRRDAATEEIEAALPLDRPSAKLLAATALYEGGRIEDGERVFRSVLEQQPANGVARVGLVEALLSQRRYAEAAVEAALEPADSPASAVAARARCFALAASGDAAALRDALAAEALGADETALYRAWAAQLEGGAAAPLSTEAAGPLLLALEALLRVADVDAFVTALPLVDATALDPRERRELLAQMYLRRGFLESAADEWIGVVQDGPDLRALVGLSQVAVAMGNVEDALVFAREAIGVEPWNEEARRLVTALEERAALAA